MMRMLQLVLFISIVLTAAPAVYWLQCVEHIRLVGLIAGAKFDPNYPVKNIPYVFTAKYTELQFNKDCDTACFITYNNTEYYILANRQKVAQGDKHCVFLQLSGEGADASGFTIKFRKQTPDAINCSEQSDPLEDYVSHLF